MCDPVSIGLSLAGAAASAAGQVISSSEANANASRAAKARNNAALAEVARQERFQQQAAPIQNTLVEEMSADKQKQNLTEAQTSRAGSAGGAVSSSDYAPSAGSTSMVGSEISRQMAKAVRDAKNTGAAQGRFAAYGDAGQKAGLAFDAGNSRLEAVNNASRGSARLLPIDQAAAENNAYKAPSGWGGGLRLLGTALSLANMGYGAFSTPGVNPVSPGDAFSGAAARTQAANTKAFLGF